MLHTEGLYPYHTLRTEHLEPADTGSQLEFYRWINANPHTIHNTLFADKAHLTRNGVNNTRNSHLRDHDNPHGTVGSNYQHRFSVNVWCGVIGDQLTGLYIFLQHLRGDYAKFLQHKLPALLQHVPLQTRRQMYYQHNGAPPHFSQVVRQYLNQQFPNQWIGHSSAQNWPPRSLDLNPLHYHVWCYVKAMLYVCKVNMREVLQRILSAARCINAAVLLKGTSPLVTRLEMYQSTWRPL